MVRINQIMLAFLFLFSVGAWATSSQTYYLHLQGTSSLEPSEIQRRAHEILIDPLYQPTPMARSSFIMQVEGPQHLFTLNLITEPLDPSKTSDFEKYRAQVESQLFLGQSVFFRPVAQLREGAQLQLGNYDSSQDDVFVQTFQYERDFQFTNLAQWLEFSNSYGRALRSSDHQVFQRYIEDFIKPSAQADLIVEKLQSNNMLAINPVVSIVLEDGSQIGPDWAGTPFLPFRFFRYCIDPKLENGACFGP